MTLAAHTAAYLVRIGPLYFGWASLLMFCTGIVLALLLSAPVWLRGFRRHIARGHRLIDELTKRSPVIDTEAVRSAYDLDARSVQERERLLARLGASDDPGGAEDGRPSG